jgi:DNA-binding response OmpR family regulator
LAHPLQDSLILIAEDQPLVALDVADALAAVGAQSVVAQSNRDALKHLRTLRLSAAIVDQELADGDCAELCRMLHEAAVPFIVHSGHLNLDEECRKGVVVPKPASAAALVRVLASLVTGPAST